MSFNAVFSKSNSIVVSWRGWLIVLGVLILAMLVIPVVWQQFERFEVGTDFRIPYELSSDYWLYNYFAKKICDEYPGLIIGDSFIWGEYVDSNKTLPSYLNKLLGKQCFANLGVNGLHPTATYGLLRYYTPVIRNKSVILFFNPLWIQSPEIDLQGQDEIRLQHTQLIPQFDAELECYQAAMGERLSVFLARYFPWISFSEHLNTLYFNGSGFKKWSIENCNILPSTDYKAINKLIINNHQAHTAAQTWQIRGIEPADYQWVDLDKSNHWRSFEKTVSLLRQRNNTVFVLVGSFNPFLILPDSTAIYRSLQKDIQSRLKDMQVNYFMIADLPTEYYTDASHVDENGYLIIAEQLVVNQNFKQWLVNGR